MNNDDKIRNALASVIIRILTPLVRVLLRNGISFSNFTELAKLVYIRVADREMTLPGKKQTVTRIATLTGIPRKEVGQIRNRPQTHRHKLYSMQRHNRAARVIGTWLRDKRFHNRRGQPASLAFEGEKNSFAELVRRSGVDIPPRPILDELLRSGTVRHLKNGRLALLSRSYVPAADDLEKIAMLGTDVRDLIKTIDHNITCEPGAAFFQRKTIYDNIPEEKLAALRDKLRKTAQAALEEFDRELAACDRDSNPRVTGTGRMRVGMNLYYFEEEYQEEENETA